MTAQNKLTREEKRKVIQLPAHIPSEVKQKYGNYRVKLCFAEQDVPNSEKDLLGLIMRVYRQRVERQMQ